MSRVINPCHCGYRGELAGMNHQAVYFSLACPECNRSVEAFTMDGLLESWNKPVEPTQQNESGDEQAQQARIAAAEAKRQRRIERNLNLTKEVAPRQEPEWGWKLQAEWERDQRNEWKSEEGALSIARGLVRRRVYRDILEYIEDCDSTHSYSIVTAPNGHKQDEAGYAFRHAYIDQYCSGGYSGDSYAGSVCIPLNAGKFLQFHYSC